MSTLPEATQDDAAARGQDRPARFRSGAVARMLGMPVATLRVWERRYAVCGPAVTASGQRLYTTADVRRLTLLRQLTERGHAISTLAPLPFAELQAVALAHCSAPGVARVPATTPRRVALVGRTLAAVLPQATRPRADGTTWQWLGPYDSLAQATQALQAQPPDALLMQVPELQADALADGLLMSPLWRDLPKAVLFSFASHRACDRLAAAGVALLREPQPPAVLSQWLHHWASGADATATTAPAQAAGAAPPPPRWDADALAAVAAHASSVACECPRQVAELLQQLTHFERYSASCASRSASDAELHAYLHHVAGQTRLLFEAALERVVLHEGLQLPTPVAAHSQG
jgi:MerR family transcriptional regulator, light-induced transcriptional regulator